MSSPSPVLLTVAIKKLLQFCALEVDRFGNSDKITPVQRMTTPPNLTNPRIAVRDLLGSIGTLKLSLAAFGVVFSVIAYYMAHSWEVAEASWQQATKDFLLSFLPNLVPGLLLVLLAFVIFRRAAEYQAELERVQVADLIEQRFISFLNPTSESVKAFELFVDVNWKEELQRARKVEIIVQYFDSWINHYSDEIRKFFDRGGEITLVIPDFAQGSIVSHVHSRFPDKDKRAITQKIRDTSDKLERLRAECSRTDAKLHITRAETMIWYCGIAFDDCRLFISPFEHARSVAVESPAFYADLTRHPGLKRWWQREMARLKSANQHPS